jgi:hypothetical protein
MDIAKELRGDMFLIANAIKKIQVSHIFVGRVLDQWFQITFLQYK